jgi:hypothetical protein
MVETSMARQNQKRYRPKLNEDTFTDGIKGKVLLSVSISNELDCRYISLDFEDKTELTITLDTRLTGKLELFDCKTGDQELIKRVGLIPDDSPSWRPADKGR